MKPFDPNPRQLEPSTNGFIWCEYCEAPVPVSVAGHEHPLAFEFGEMRQGILDAIDRAERLELAESVLCGLAFDHARDMLALSAADGGRERCEPDWQCALCNGGRES